MEAPECPVCLQNYDGATAIPRVINCGHTVCEACLARLPERFPLTVRCPACTVLVKFPPQGPSSLPKNLELLSLSTDCRPSPTQPRRRPELPPSLGRFWSDDFYSAWKPWILSSDAVSPEEHGGGFSRAAVLVDEGDRREVRLVALDRVLPCLDGLGFEFCYAVRVLNCLRDMREKTREGLGLILRARCRRIARVYGLWGDLDGDGFLYLVCERMGEKRIGDLRTEPLAFLSFGVEIVEALIDLHSRGFVAGFLGPSCFSFDEFGHACVNVSEVLVTGRKVHDSVAGSEPEVAARNLWKDGIFISPEMLVRLGESMNSIRFCSDTWSVSCLLLSILGEEFTDEFPSIIGGGNEYDQAWTGRVSSLLDSRLGPEFAPAKDMLLKCLAYDPESRPLLSEVRRSMRELIIKPQFDMASLMKLALDGTSYVVLGELCHLPEEKNKGDNSNGREDGEQRDGDQIKGERADKNIVDGLSGGTVKFKDLRGHRDCITGIAVGGGFIFSSSYDKTIRVWSLQDFTHVHTFEGHEQKVMAIVYVDQEEESLCISGDSGGGVFVWGTNVPFRKEPLKKWNEHKDWRFSGIHALCFSKSGYLYTGSGDKSIKAWLLQDGHLACTMNGHRSVVSTLAICDEVLYSGSLDGTIRLWSLSDHTPLTVLGEDSSRAVASVLSLAVDTHMLIAACDNGIVKVWRNDVFMRSMQVHKGAIFATFMEGEWLFTGGWDKIVNIQELSGDEFHVDPKPIGTVPFDSAVTAIRFSQGKLFVGCADRLVRCITMNADS